MKQERTSITNFHDHLKQVQYGIKNLDSFCMKFKKLLLIPGLLLLFTGCDTFYMICSLNPFYIEKNITLNAQIEGSWKAKSTNTEASPFKELAFT